MVIYLSMFIYQTLSEAKTRVIAKRFPNGLLKICSLTALKLFQLRIQHSDFLVVWWKLGRNSKKVLYISPIGNYYAVLIQIESILSNDTFKCCSESKFLKINIRNK